MKVFLMKIGEERPNKYLRFCPTTKIFEIIMSVGTLGAKRVPDDTVLDRRLSPFERKITYINNYFRRQPKTI